MSKKVLIGTSNNSKITYLQELLKDYQVEFYTLADLKIESTPEEEGNTPLENAVIKAKSYGHYCDYVICNDAGLYIKEIPLDDPRQPGLHVRSPYGIRLNDEEMIAYYTNLVKSLGGKVVCYYLQGFAVYNMGLITSFVDQGSASLLNNFYLVSDPHPARHEGWPLDSISQNIDNGKYFVEYHNLTALTKTSDQEESYKQKLLSFLVSGLDLKLKQ